MKLKCEQCSHINDVEQFSLNEYVWECHCGRWEWLSDEDRFRYMEDFGRNLWEAEQDLNDGLINFAGSL